MKLFGSIAELVKATFRANNQQVDLKPNTSTTYTATRTVELPEGDANHVLVSRDSTDTLTNKSLTSSQITDFATAVSANAAVTANTAKTFDSLAPTTTKGDLPVHNGTANVRLPVGSDGQVLSADSAQTSGLAWTSPLTNPMTTAGDIIIGGVSGAVTRLAGDTTTTKKFLTGTGDGANAGTPTWATIAATDVPLATSSTQGAVSTFVDWTDFTISGLSAGASSPTTVTAQYCIVGKRMTVQFYLRSLTISGAPATISFNVPNSATIAKTAVALGLCFDNTQGTATTPEAMEILVDSGTNTKIQCRLLGTKFAGGFTNSSSNTTMGGQITFTIN